MAGSSIDAQIRLLLVEDMPQVSNYVRSLLDTQTKIRLLEVVRDGRLVVDQIREHQPDVLIVDALLQGRLNGLAVAQDVRDAGLDLPIIALTVPQKPIKVGEGMGHTSVLSMPFSGYDFLRLLQDNACRSSSGRARSTVARLFVLRGQGRRRNDHVAYNVAASIAEQGFRTALVDGSLQFGDVRALLRLAEDVPSIVQLPTTHIQRTDLEQVMYRDPSGVEVLLAPPRIEMAEMVTPRDIERLLSLMRKIYNVVIIDTATNVDDTVLAYLDGSDLLVQVLTYEWTRCIARAQWPTRSPRSTIRPTASATWSTGPTRRAGCRATPSARSSGGRADFEVVSDGSARPSRPTTAVKPFNATRRHLRISRDVAAIADALTRDDGWVSRATPFVAATQ